MRASQRDVTSSTPSIADFWQFFPGVSGRDVERCGGQRLLGPLGENRFHAARVAVVVEMPDAHRVSVNGVARLDRFSDAGQTARHAGECFRELPEGFLEILLAR